MKVSNETKVGALTAIAITVLILGFNFLKGKNITERSHTIYAVFPDVDGLAIASPVLANGLQVGRVADLEAKDENLTGIVVTITLSKNIKLPANSYLTMTRSLLGSTSVKVIVGSSNQFVQEGDTLDVKLTPDMLTDVKNSLNPAVEHINKTLVALENVIQKLNTVMDPRTQNNLQAIISNLNNASASLSQLLNPLTGKLSHTLNNVDRITANLAAKNGSIDSSLDNIQVLSGKLAQLKFSETLGSLKKTLDELELTLSKMNSREGTIGALLHERKLYEEIRQTNRSLTTLLDDVKTHPKRYINFSVFGKKDKSTPLQTPIYDSIPFKGNK